MIYISHRGNLNGKIPGKENSPEYIIEALEKGFDVEIDVRYIDGEYWTGHKKPQYKLGKHILQNGKLWCHAKDINTMFRMIADNIHCFFHIDEKVVLTSRGYLWTYPGEQLTPASIAVLPDERTNGIGICSDRIEVIKCNHS